ncbi:hypothetical protein C8R44DRAFT_740662 [Mycena epipterygia]|nr:hypothetical protein C8R44DRAFT_740662 [Mycena epipterygia]
MHKRAVVDHSGHPLPISYGEAHSKYPNPLRATHHPSPRLHARRVAPHLPRQHRRLPAERAQQRRAAARLRRRRYYWCRCWSGWEWFAFAFAGEEASAEFEFAFAAESRLPRATNAKGGAPLANADGGGAPSRLARPPPRTLREAQRAMEEGAVLMMLALRGVLASDPEPELEPVNVEAEAEGARMGAAPGRGTTPASTSCVRRRSSVGGMSGTAASDAPGIDRPAGVEGPDSEGVGVGMLREEPEPAYACGLKPLAVVPSALEAGLASSGGPIWLVSFPARRTAAEHGEHGEQKIVTRSAFGRVRTRSEKHPGSNRFLNRTLPPLVGAKRFTRIRGVHAEIDDPKERKEYVDVEISKSSGNNVGIEDNTHGSVDDRDPHRNRIMRYTVTGSYDNPYRPVWPFGATYTVTGTVRQVLKFKNEVKSTLATETKRHPYTGSLVDGMDASGGALESGWARSRLGCIDSRADICEGMSDVHGEGKLLMDNIFLETFIGLASSPNSLRDPKK